MSDFRYGSDHIIRAGAFERMPWLEHGFGTRHTVKWPPVERLVELKQIHSDIVYNADTAAPGCIGEGDGLLSSRPGIMVGVRTADCQPILLADARLRVVAAVHAGWRGTVAGIVSKAVRRMEADYGCNSADIHAAIGPAIGHCCFEAGPEVAVQFQELFPERDDLDRKTTINLNEANRRHLIRAGLAECRIYTGAPCTFCCDAFHSYRRDHTDNRMYSAIGVRG